MKRLKLTIHSDEEMQDLGASLAQILELKDVVYLIGGLGAGKTTLVRGLVRALSYSGRVTSPTFTLMNIYDSDPPVYHLDFYRLDGGDISDLGLEDYLERDGLALIEWPGSGTGRLPEEALMVEIALTEEDYDLERKVCIYGVGKQYEERTERLMKIVDSGVR
ncbi:MAG: tRNA (adenosine(37)-N6)-threonylcarbamoyltransferase complex ATPase subunit type 1 TsaE [Bacillota bacterium]|nr:tRNA (adenosine(37)-N6)-threonylcarbamoyltransferase complex ATPase subunit type 1 TsaE [Bacillota bacterium]